MTTTIKTSLVSYDTYSITVTSNQIVIAQLTKSDEYINYVVIFINFLFTKLLIPGKDYLSRTCIKFLVFWVLNAFQLCTCLAL